MTKEEVINSIGRPATVFEVGGFKPDDHILSSWIGKVMVCEPGETWPQSYGKPMIPLVQLNLTDVPYLPENMRDIQFLTVFIDSEEIPSDDETNGDGWCLRAYTSTANLQPISIPTFNSIIKPFQLRAKLIQNDFPCSEDCPITIPAEFEEDYYELFPNIAGIKLGGWPSLIQSEIWWAAGNENVAEPMYAFQIDSVEKANWQWADAGVGYFGRGTAQGFKDEWAFTWQCL